MKKLMTLVLAVCMLLAATAAFAEATVFQDEIAPELINVGGEAYATVYDAEGNATQITDKNQITLIDISKRAADDALMAAAAKSGDFAAMNYVVVEKFYIAAEGAATIEASFLTQPWQNISAAFVTTDGTAWTKTDCTVNGSYITIKTVPGVVALASAPEAATESFPAIDETIEHGNYTPSIVAKPAPGVISGVIVGADGSVVVDLTVGAQLVVTPVSVRLYIKDICIYDNLKSAYAEILEAASLEDLGVADVANMIVRDLFEVTLYGESLQSGAFNLKATFEAEAPAAVLVNGANGWKLIPAENVIDNGNGTVTVTLSELGTVAFLADAAVSGNAKTSPAT